MSLFTAIHHWLNPHCPECRVEARERREFEKEDEVSLAIEVLERQLELANHDKDRLLDRLLREPEKPVERELPATYVPPRHVPWAVRRQMLEAEDRKKAQLIKNGASQPDRPAPVAQVKVEDLEKELGVSDEPDNKETEDKVAQG